MGSALVHRGGAAQALAVVEASYRLDGSDADWLRGVLDAAHADIEHGCGSYAFICYLGQKGVFENMEAALSERVGLSGQDADGLAGEVELGPAYVERALDPRFSAIISDLNRTVPRAFFDLLMKSAVHVGGFTQTAPPQLIEHFTRFGPPRGIHDSFSVFVQDGEGWGLDITAPTEMRVEVVPRVRGIWKRVGVHLASGMRLRRRLRRARAVRDAVLSPSGTITHAEGDLRRNRSAREALVAAVRDVERARTARERADPERALELWKGLVAGEWSLVDQWESDGRRYLAAYRNRPELRDPRGLTPLESLVLRYASLACSNKEIAFTLGISLASVESAVRQLLRKLRCRRRSDLVTFADPAQARHLQLDLEGESIGVLSLPRVRNQAALARLSPSERAVVEGVIDGRTSAEIARSRGTSALTVANQVRSVFDKLGVGSRAQLVRVLTRAT